MPASVITSKGQATIPKKIRNHLHLRPGDRIGFVVEEDGKVILEPINLDISNLEGILHRPAMKVISSNKMKEAIRSRFNKKSSSKKHLAM